MSAQPETWRVSTIEGIFETDLETLKQWIVEGCVLPTDKVSKGTLNWIEAGRVPKLKGAFNGEVETVSPQLDQGGWQTPPSTEPTETFSTQPVNSSVSQSAVFPSASQARTAAGCDTHCHNHPDAEPKYICRTCATPFCEVCPRFVGNSKIAVCALCGDLCRSFAEVKSKVARTEFQSSGFGFGDLLTAVRYPLQHKWALAGGALLYGILLLAGFRGSLFAWMIMFGCISHVISQVAWGRLDRSFMPDFSEFSMWEDVVQPIFLGVGITIVSWGPMLVLVLALVLGLVSRGDAPLSPAGQMQKVEQHGPSQEDLGVLMDPEANGKDLEKANQKLNELRPGTQIAREAERSKNETDDPTAMVKQLMPLLGAGIFVALVLLALIAWGIFYYPMALTVAGYTQSFLSVVNPLVGLDTIRRMGATYFKAFGMVLLIQFVAAIIGGTVALILSPLSLPFMGNLPANFINGSVTFYFNLVIACLLGLSLYKSADRLGISFD